MIGELALQRGLHQPLGQRRQQPALTGQLQPALAGPPDQPVDQLLVDGVENIRPGSLHRGRLAIDQRVEIHHRLGDQVSHGVSLLDRSYTVVFTVPIERGLRHPSSAEGALRWQDVSVEEFANDQTQ